MKSHLFWPVAASLGLGGVIVAISQVGAQRRDTPPDRAATAPAMPGPFGPPAGRFAVANASSSQVLVLDTATGQVYRVKEADFKAAADLPRAGGRGPMRPEEGEGPPRPRRRFEDEDPKEKDKEGPPPPRRGRFEGEGKEKDKEPLRRPRKDDDE